MSTFTWALRTPLHKLHDFVFRPIPVVFARRGTDEPAVAAVFANRELDGWIARHLGIAEWRSRYERVVFGRDDQRGDAKLVDDAHRAGAVVVVFSAAESEMRCSVCFVEFAYRLDRRQLSDVESARPTLVFPPHPPLQVLHEI